MHIGIDSFASAVTDPDTGLTVSPTDRVAHLLEEVERADAVGLDSSGIGEHHRSEYYDSAPAVLLAAAAARTSRIRLNSAVTVLSANDPVRVFQDFATPIWLSVGGTPDSFVRAGVLGLPLMVAIIGGEPHRFGPLIDLYREAGRRAGHPAEQLRVGLHCFGFVGDTTQQAKDDFYPGWSEIFTKIARERGGSAPSRAAYEATTGPTGAYFIGDAETVATKMLSVSDALGGIDRISLQMTNVRLAHDNLLHGIELLGTAVAPIVRAADRAVANGSPSVPASPLDECGPASGAGVASVLRPPGAPPVPHAESGTCEGCAPGPRFTAAPQVR